MGVDFRKRRPQGCIPQPNCFDMQSMWTDRNFHVFSHNFAVPDFFGRGYTRTTSFAYVTQVPKKLTRILKPLRRAFSKAALELKQEGQRVFLNKIDECLYWVDYEISKYNKNDSVLGGQQGAVGNSSPASKYRNGVDMEIYKDYFEIELNLETLYDIKKDMREIREEFSEQIREIPSTSSWKIRPKGERPHYRPQCSKKEFLSLMEVLSEFSIKRMKSRMQQILAKFQGSALDIVIERKTKKRVNATDLVFNIGTLCQMPISISKDTPPRPKWSSRYEPIKRLHSPYMDRCRYYGSSNGNYTSDSESLDYVGDTVVTYHTTDEEKQDLNGTNELSLNHSGLNVSSQKAASSDLPARPHSNSSNQEKKSSERNICNDILSIDNYEDQLSLDPGPWATALKQEILDNKDDPGDRVVLSASSNPSTKDKTESKKTEITLDGTALSSKPNQSGTDSPISTSSSSSSTNFTKVPSRTSQLDLDNLLVKLLFHKTCKRYAEQILYTIFIGRPLLLVGSSKYVKTVIKYARAVSMLVPGANDLSENLCRTEPLTVQELADLKIVGISERAFKATSQNVLDWCSYFIYDEMIVEAPRYRAKNSNQWLTNLLNEKSCKTSSQFRRFLQTELAKMQLQAYIYYWMLIIGVVKAPVKDAPHAFSGPFLRLKEMHMSERAAEIRNILGISDKRDIKILEHWARIIERRVEIASVSQVSSLCFPPLKEDEGGNISLRDRLLAQHSKAPTSLHISRWRSRP